MESLYCVENLNVSLPLRGQPLHIVRGVSLEVGRGEALGIVGESGSGKSVLAMSLIGLLPKSAKVTSDRMDFLGQDLTGDRGRRLGKLRGRSIAMVFQDPMTSLNPLLSIGEQLTEAYRLRTRANAKQAAERAAYVLERVGISDPKTRLRQYPHNLSGGMRQRVVIAMALMEQPDLIIADEPTTALDVSTQAQILALLHDLRQEFGLSIIVNTHDLNLVSQLVDRIAVMYAGNIVECGPTADILRQPSHPYTKALLSCAPRHGQQEHGTPLGTIPGIVPSLLGKIDGCSFADRCERAVDECRSLEMRDFMAAPSWQHRCLRGPGAPLEDTKI